MSTHIDIVVVDTYKMFCNTKSVAFLLSILSISLAAENDLLKCDDDIKFVSKSEWVAAPSEDLSPLATPIPLVVIAHTASYNCMNKTSCMRVVRFIQDFHVQNKHWGDIAYNFLIGGDGNIYEGRGWNIRGAHTMNWNAKSLGIGMIGDFHSNFPTKPQLTALWKLIEYGVESGMINKNYNLVGHRQLIKTTSPGDILYEKIKYWPHWVENATQCQNNI